MQEDTKATNECVQPDLSSRRRSTKFLRAYSDDGFKYLKEIVVLGDTGIGKTMLLIRLRDNRFDATHTRTIYDRMDFEVNVDGIDHCVRIHDTNSQRDLSLSRASIYRDAACLILCFAVNDRKSFDNIVRVWAKEAKCYRRAAPVVLVATKTDMRSVKGVSCVSTAEGQALSERIGASGYVECSSKDNSNVSEAIIGAIRTAINGGLDAALIEAQVTEPIASSSTKCCTIL